jgi:hypothetical protein
MMNFTRQKCDERRLNEKRKLGFSESHLVIYVWMKN